MANDLQIFEQSNLAIFQKLAEFKKAQEQMKSQEEELKAQIEKAMEEYCVKSFKNEYITISYVEGSTSESIDLKELEKKEPELYKDLLGDYPKITTRKPYVKFLVK
jgi:pantothenate kinase-related protein Tda10